MEIQQSMCRNSSYFYHAFATTLLANPGDFFNTHAWVTSATNKPPPPPKKEREPGAAELEGARGEFRVKYSSPPPKPKGALLKWFLPGVVVVIGYFGGGGRSGGGGGAVLSWGAGLSFANEPSHKTIKWCVIKLNEPPQTVRKD